MGTTPAQAMRESIAYDTPLPPTEAGQRVRTVGFGGEVTLCMEWGEVVRFNRTGYPVVRTSHQGETREVTDRWACFKQWDDEGQRWVRPSSAQLQTND